MNTMITKPMLTAAVACLALTQFASAAASDDFSSYSAGDDALDFTTSGVTWTGGQRDLWVVADSGGPFGDGNYVNMASRDGNFSFVNADFSSISVTTLSFDLALGAEDGFLRLSANDTVSGDATRTVDLGTSAFTGGEAIEAGGFIAGTAYHLDLVVNESASSVSSNGNTIAADTTALYVDGVLAWSGANFNSHTSINRFGIWMNGEDTGDVLTGQLDNFMLTDSAYVVPEPSAYALIGGLCALGFVAVRRRM